MSWIIGGVLGMVLLISISVGTFGQPFAPWWIASKDVRSIQLDVSPTPQPKPMVPAQPKPRNPITQPAHVADPMSLIVAPVPEISVISALIETAKGWIGTPYLWGGCSRRGVDCSCFMQSIFLTVGVHLPRVTVDQIKVASPITREQAETGDLVFFDNTCSGCGSNPTHVGMYLGNGQMIDAGDPVRIEPVYGGHNARFGRVL